MRMREKGKETRERQRDISPSGGPMGDWKLVKRKGKPHVRWGF